MKTKKSAATAALKTADKKATSGAAKISASPSAPTPAPSAPIAAASTPTPAPSAPKTAAATPKTPSEALTTIEVKLDVGFGNSLFLRGQGSGLTWDRGVLLDCVDGIVWRWSQKVSDPVTFKVLLNDQVWSAGSDLVVAPGQKVEISPCFA